MAHMRFTFVILTVVTVIGEGYEFLKAAPKVRNERVSEEDIQTSLLEEVEETLGTGSAAKRLHLLEAILQPMYTALPKNEHGNLGHATVRYALHRLFIMRHGWHIKGLSRDAAMSNVTSPLGVLKDQVPSYIQSLFEKRLGEKGVGLHDLAVIAATMEHLIHKEVVSKLGDVYASLKILPTQPLRETLTDKVLDTYMMAFILGEDLKNLSTSRVLALVREMPELYVGWSSTQKFVRRIRDNVTTHALTNRTTTLDFAALAHIVEVVGEEFGSFQSTECQQLKATLMNVESRGSGRAKLGDFYKPGLDGNWQFQESAGYLRQIGALDESDPRDPSVVIVNYIHSHANCMAPSGFYSVCCKDECEDLFGHLEETIAAPEATSSVIAALVKKLPSSTMGSPRHLSATLLKRLDSIAAEHGGTVPLHGRLFAQWMHHAYPRECPYPHASGTTIQQSPEEYAEDQGIDDASATDEEMLKFNSSVNRTWNEDPDESLPWSPEEELLIARPGSQVVKTSSILANVRPVVLLAFCGSLALALSHTLRTVAMPSDDICNGKFVV